MQGWWLASCQQPAQAHQAATTVCLHFLAQDSRAPKRPTPDSCRRGKACSSTVSCHSVGSVRQHSSPVSGTHGSPASADPAPCAAPCCAGTGSSCAAAAAACPAAAAASHAPQPSAVCAQVQQQRQQMHSIKAVSRLCAAGGDICGRHTTNTLSGVTGVTHTF